MPASAFRVAAVQSALRYEGRDAAVERVCERIAEAARTGARLIVFPEAIVPGYPAWIWHLRPNLDGSAIAGLYAELLDQGVTIPSPATERICKAAGEAGVYVVVGMTERNAEASNASLYNSILYVDPSGQIMGKHRKLVPTGPERMVWAQGDGSTLKVYDSSVGRLGGLICYENLMPLARYALYAWGIQIYVAPTAARGELWLATLRHIAMEGRVFVIGCGFVERRSDIPTRYAFRNDYQPTMDEWIDDGDSAIIDPEGSILAGPLHQAEGILYADIDPAQMTSSKWIFDAAGHYARPDVFRLEVRTAEHPLLVVDDGVDGPGVADVPG
jgi:nitrilase